MADRTYISRGQYDFREAKSTSIIMFSLRQSRKKSCKQRRSFYNALTDLTNAFDLVIRASSASFTLDWISPQAPGNDHIFPG